jgi:diguanylate cyclase (GGDEF)-like protein
LYFPVSCLLSWEKSRSRTAIPLNDITGSYYEARSDATIPPMAKLGAPSAGAAEAVHLVGMALSSTLSPGRLIGRLCSTLSALIEADRVAVVEDCQPADPRFALLQQAFSSKEAVAAGGVLCAPMFTERETVGAILAERTRPFGEADLALVATVAPQAALALHHARLYDRATSDGLTGLPNRQRFTVELEDAVAAGALSLILVDVDNLKDKTEVYGRSVTDRALEELGQLMSGRLPIVARTGDDDFGAILEGVDAARARDMAEDLRKAVNDRVFDERHEGIHLTVSVGVAALRPGEMASALFARAADSLASAKRAGRNRVDVAR